MEDNTLKDKILENAQAPAFVQNDSMAARQHDLKDQIEADRYLRSLSAATKPTRGIRVSIARSAREC